MTLDELLELRARAVRARRGWFWIEQAAVDAGDQELDTRIAIARLALLDAIDRIDQLLAPDVVEDAA